MRQYCRGFLFVLLAFLLCCCGTTVECIDPDDWGGDLTVTLDSTGAGTAQPINPANPQGDQYIAWTKAYPLNGKPVVMIVDNSVNSTYGNLSCGDPNNYTSAANSWRFIFANPSFQDSPFKCGSGGCPVMSLCQFNSVSSPYFPWYPNGYSMVTDTLPDLNSPCVLTMGVGLYSLITKGETPDGKTFACNSDMQDQTNCIAHIGNNACIGSDGKLGSGSCTTPFINQACPAGGAAFTPPSDCQTSKCHMYFKILDRYYTDNYGSYKVRFKQGVYQEKSPGIITTFIAMAQGVLCSATENVFTNIVSDQYPNGVNPYVYYIRVLLVLYIMFLGIGYLTGFLEFSHQELITRVFKMAVVIQLTTTASSWNFFYDFFFNFFLNGVGEVTGIIFGDGIQATKVSIPGITPSSSCAFQNLSGFASFDQAFKELLSYQTSRKIMALMTWKGGGYVGGAILVVIFYIMIGLVLFIILKSILIYIVCYLAISMLIILAPIFIPFILFKVTRHWFDKWLKNLISYFIQPIIILTFAFFLLQIFMSQMHYLFGYRVCYKNWFTFVSSKVFDIQVFAWQTDFQPSPTKMCIITPNAILASNNGNATINTSTSAMAKATYALENFPGTNPCSTNYNYYNQTGSVNPQYCEPYTCTQMRYPDYPYLDPNINSDLSRINQLQNDELITLKDLGIFVLIVWFMMKFNDVVPSIAKKIGGTPRSYANMAAAGGALGGSLMKWGGKAVVGAAVNPLYKKAFGANRDITKDAKLTVKRINTLRDAAVNKAAEIKNTASSVIDDKLKNGPAPVRGLYKAASFAKSVLTPDKALGSAVESLGKNTTGRLFKKADQAKEFVQGFGEHVAGKAGDAFKSASARAQDAVSSFRNNPIGSLKSAKDKLANTFRRGVPGTPTSTQSGTASNIPVSPTSMTGIAAGSKPNLGGTVQGAKKAQVDTGSWTPPPSIIDEDNHDDFGAASSTSTGGKQERLGDQSSSSSAVIEQGGGSRGQQQSRGSTTGPDGGQVGTTPGGQQPLSPNQGQGNGGVPVDGKKNGAMKKNTKK